jgi:broad specificity phosphatase PhoE
LIRATGALINYSMARSCNSHGLRFGCPSHIVSLGENSAGLLLRADCKKKELKESLSAQSIQAHWGHVSSIYLVRHAQASFGSRDYDRLSTIGQIQAGLLGSWIKECGLKVDQVVLGGRTRHLQTATICLAGLQTAPQVSEWQVFEELNEFDFADILRRSREGPVEAVRWEDTADSRIKFREILRVAMSLWVSAARDGYREPFSEFKRRCLGGFLRLAENAAQGDVWVFTSGGPISAILLQLLEMPDPQMSKLTSVLANTAVSKIVCENARPPSLTTFNSISHLEREQDSAWITLL